MVIRTSRVLAILAAATLVQPLVAQERVDEAMVAKIRAEAHDRGREEQGLLGSRAYVQQHFNGEANAPAGDHEANAAARDQPDALKQASAVIATVLYHAAMRDGTFPRQ